MEQDSRDLRNYIWSYFALHSEQRMKTFNFFIILSTLIIGFIATCIEKNFSSLFLLFASLMLSLLSVTFWKLDARNVMLIKAAEESLIRLEDRFLAGIPETERDSWQGIMIFSAEKNAASSWRGERIKRVPWNKKSIYSFSELLNLVFLVFFMSGLSIHLYCWWQILCW